MDKKGVHFVAEENKEIVVIDETTIKSKIYYIQNQKVMLDFELAEIYGYETKTFNQQVKNNIEKFDEDFRFQLTKEYCICKIGTDELVQMKISMSGQCPKGGLL